MKLYVMEEKNEVTYKGVFVLETGFSTIASLFEVKNLKRKQFFTNEKNELNNLLWNLYMDEINIFNCFIHCLIIQPFMDGIR